MKKGYVVFEGLDFSGKSTLTKKVATQLGYRLTTEMFTESANGKEIKKAIINNLFDKETEIFLLGANRLEGFRKVITPFRDNVGVIADRSVISTMVYQTDEQGGWTQEAILNFNIGILEKESHNLFPDHLFFLDISHDTYLERLSKSNREIDEKEKMLMEKNNWDLLRERFISAIKLIQINNPQIKVHFITPEISTDEVISFINFS